MFKDTVWLLPYISKAKPSSKGQHDKTGKRQFNDGKTDNNNEENDPEEDRPACKHPHKDSQKEHPFDRIRLALRLFQPKAN